MITSLQQSCECPLGENPRYHIIICFSWPNFCIHSLEVTKVAKPVPSDLFRDIKYANKLFVEFLGFNTLFKSDTTDPANHSIVGRC